MESIEKYSLLHTCRTCTKHFDESGLDSFGLFADLNISIKNTSVSVKVFEILNLLELKIIPNDELPQRICTECKKFLIDLYSFRSICEASQKNLHYYFQKYLSPECRMDFFEENTKNPISPTAIGANAANSCSSSILPNEFEFLNVDDVYDNKEKMIKHYFVIDHDHDGKSKETEQYSKNVLNVNESENQSEKCEKIDNTIYNEDNPFEIKNVNNLELGNYDSSHIIDKTTIAENVTRNEGNIPIHISNTDNYLFQCKKCYRNFPERSLLENHGIFGECSVIIDNECDDGELELFDQPRYERNGCPICHKVYKTKQSLRIHIQHKHKSTGEIFECDICQRSYDLKQNLKTHMVKMHIVSDYTCPHCSLKFTKRHLFRYHLKSHNPNKKYKCKYCEKSFLQGHHLIYHENTHTGYKQYLCAECGDMFKSRKNLQLHQFRHTGEKPYFCDICDKGFIQSGDYKKHMQRHLALEIKGEDESKIKRKNRGVNERKNKVRNNGEKKAPYRIVHPGREFNEESYQFHCTLCTRSFKLPSSLQSHVEKSHNVERKFKCTECGNTYKRIEHLRNHIKCIHLKLRPYTCEYCNKPFADKCQLKVHIRYHTGERRFKCDSCEKAYYSQSDLRRHTSTHTGELLYKCDICSMKFPHYPGLSEHHKIHL